MDTFVVLDDDTAAERLAAYLRAQAKAKKRPKRPGQRLPPRSTHRRRGAEQLDSEQHVDTAEPESCSSGEETVSTDDDSFTDEGGTAWQNRQHVLYTKWRARLHLERQRMQAYVAEHMPEDSKELSKLVQGHMQGRVSRALGRHWCYHFIAEVERNPMHYEILGPFMHSHDDLLEQLSAREIAYTALDLLQCC